jgi:exoribonuclease R
MQYYKEYDIINNASSIIVGTLEKKKDLENNCLYVDNNEILYNNRAIIGDKVHYLNNEIIGIKERSNKKITGIIHLDSKIKYGSYKNKCLYLFKPTNRDYPNFYIPIEPKSLKKIFAVIEFKEWKTTDKLPIGTLLETIGLVGDKIAEIEHLRIYYEIRNYNWKVKPEKLKNDEESLKLNNSKIDYEVFSIDPLGSKDIDDAFHFKRENGQFEIGIHIASPFTFFNSSDDIKNILNRVSTVYLSDLKYNLLPNNYADNILSLLEGNSRHALSIILILDEELNIISETVQKTVVKNNKNFHYDEFDKIYFNNEYNNDNNNNKSNKRDPNIVSFLEISKKFFDISDTVFDSHILVEKWMIYSNQFIAKYLISNKYSNIILRKHSGKLEEKEEDNNFNHDLELEKIGDSKLINFMKFKKENSAVYEIYDPSILEEDLQIHSKLGYKFYTHFTSPIRRAVDFYIHMLIFKKLDGNNNLELDLELDLDLDKILEKINVFTKNMRKFSRQIKRLDFLYLLKDNNTNNTNNTNLETYCYITKITKHKISLYLPEYNLEEKVIIISYKLDDVTEIEIFNENCIKFRIDGELKEYKLFEKKNVKLHVFTSFENIFDKLKIEIL